MEMDTDSLPPRGVKHIYMWKKETRKKREEKTKPRILSCQIMPFLIRVVQNPSLFVRVLQDWGTSQSPRPLLMLTNCSENTLTKELCSDNRIQETVYHLWAATSHKPRPSETSSCDINSDWEQNMPCLFGAMTWFQRYATYSKQIP